MRNVKYFIKTPRQIKNLAIKNEKNLFVVFGSLYMIGEFIK
jgi:folylpolyglutamate synthase/dihydropteroate synthase